MITKLAQIGLVDGNPEIIGQYWDKIILTIGIWNYYLFTGDVDLLRTAYPAIVNTMAKAEREEFDAKRGLFRGAAVYGDGVSAYPEIYADSEIEGKGDTYSAIYMWPDQNPSHKAKVGFGLPMMALSTNAVYYQGYVLLSKIEKALGVKVNKNWAKKASKMRAAINKEYWNEKKQGYNYLVDEFGGCDYQEGLGWAFAMLFDVPSAEQKEAMLKTVNITPHGIAAVYPSYPRYKNKSADSYGRHSGAVWPHVQGFWADAALKAGDVNHFEKELYTLSAAAMRDKLFMEIYHPTTGLPYGGLQEPFLKDETIWFNSQRQTWSATAYLRMVLYNLCGFSFSEEGVSINPFMARSVESLDLIDLAYRDANITLSVKGKGNTVQSCTINGKKSEPFIPSNATGDVNVEIVMGN